VHDRVALLQHNITDSNGKIDTLKQTISRDAKQRVIETQEMVKFREDVMAGYNRQIIDLENKLSQLEAGN
jgi:hypothetical protein